MIDKMKNHPAVTIIGCVSAVAVVGLVTIGLLKATRDDVLTDNNRHNALKLNDKVK